MWNKSPGITTILMSMKCECEVTNLSMFEVSHISLFLINIYYQFHLLTLVTTEPHGCQTRGLKSAYMLNVWSQFSIGSRLRLNKALVIDGFYMAVNINISGHPFIYLYA